MFYSFVIHPCIAAVAALYKTTNNQLGSSVDFSFSSINKRMPAIR